MACPDVSSDLQASLDLWQTMLNAFFRLSQDIRPVFAEFGLTGAQWRVFRALGELAGEGLTAGQISDRLCVTPGNTTGVLDKLEESGLVERRPHPDDRRALLVGLTAAGEQLYRQVRPAYDLRVAEVFACLSEAEKRELLAGLQRVLAHAGPRAAEAADQ